MTNEGKPYVSFDNQGHPLIELHFDTGQLQKAVDNSVYIVVTILGVIMLALCGALVWYIIRLHSNYNITRKMKGETHA
jgi:heme/copper-type cytochrome/quinol oxidase subunit 2